MWRSASVVRQRTETGTPDPSPQTILAPLAVMNVSVPRRMNCLKSARNIRSIEVTSSKRRHRKSALIAGARFLNALRLPFHWKPNGGWHRSGEKRSDEKLIERPGREERRMYRF